MLVFFHVSIQNQSAFCFLFLILFLVLIALIYYILLFIARHLSSLPLTTIVCRGLEKPLWKPLLGIAALNGFPFVCGGFVCTQAKIILDSCTIAKGFARVLPRKPWQYCYYPAKDTWRVISLSLFSFGTRLWTKRVHLSPLCFTWNIRISHWWKFKLFKTQGFWKRVYKQMDFPERPTSRARSPSCRRHGGWISDSDYLGEISLLCSEVGYICCLFC